MNQSSLDVWEIRGLAAMIRILEDRVGQPVKYTPATMSVLNSYLNRLQKVLDQMEVGVDGDPLSDIDRMDRWFCTGLENLSKYIKERIEAGPPICERYKAEILEIAQRMARHVQVGQTGVSRSHDEQKTEPSPP